jgi:hypothetical protein
MTRPRSKTTALGSVSLGMKFVFRTAEDGEPLTRGSMGSNASRSAELSRLWPQFHQLNPSNPANGISRLCESTLSREWAISNIFSPIFTVQLSEQSPAGACHFVATARTSSSGRWLYDAHRTGSLAGTETGLEASTPSMCWVGAVEICTARNHAHRLRFR